MKTCSKCKQEKELTEFWKDRSRPDGHRSCCIKCKGGRVRLEDVKVKNGKKRCSKCEKIKPISEFNKDSRQSSGIRPDCKECKKLSDRKSYLKNIEKRKTSTKKYVERQEIKDRIKKYKKEYRKKHVGYLPRWLLLGLYIFL